MHSILGPINSVARGAPLFLQNTPSPSPGGGGGLLNFIRNIGGGYLDIDIKFRYHLEGLNPIPQSGTPTPWFGSVGISVILRSFPWDYSPRLQKAFFAVQHTYSSIYYME